MEHNRKNGFSDAAKQLASAALFGKQKAAGKAAIGFISLLLLPLMFITMLPGVIFGGFAEAYSPADPDDPILNSEIALVETAREISESIREVLREALAVTIADIGTSFQASGADNYEIENPYESDLSFSANQFVSMYCAAKGNQIVEISIEDMIAMLRANLEHLYIGSPVTAKSSLPSMSRRSTCTKQPRQNSIRSVWRNCPGSANCQRSTIWFLRKRKQRTPGTRKYAAIWAIC